ncbi:MAG: polymer-forming cytoskeletal protein [Anaerolineales bacterium]
MKHAVRLFSLFAVLALLLLPASPAYAKGLLDGEVIFGSTYTLQSGQTQTGDVVIFGGVGLIEDGATVNGALVLFGGSLSVKGAVNGDVIVFGGAVTLGSTARVSGDVVTIGAALQRDEGAVVSGQVITNAGGSDLDFEDLPPSVIVPNNPQTPSIPDVSGPVREALNPLGRALGILFRALALGLLALLVTLFLPRQTDYISNAVARQPILAGGLGLLTVVLFPVALLLLIITILLIPVALLAILALAVAVVWGWLALGMEVGQRLMAMLKVEWPLPVGAALGTFLLTLVTDTIGVIPCIGWIAPVMVSILGLGGVLMTSFGTRIVLPPDGFTPVPGPAWERRPEPEPAPEAPAEPPAPPKPRTPPAGRKMAAVDDEPLPPTS